MINEFIGEYRFLSNFWSCYIEWDGVEYPSVENAYQAAKTDNLDERKYFVICKASEAKKRGQIITLRPTWESEKFSVMKSLLMQKFTRHPDLTRRLLKTSGQKLEEGNWWGDRVWGAVNGQGQNMLGVLLMEVRDKIELEKGY